ncbi:hypothetical protein ILYODFUR_035458, partial [Ilyodon furcidens]
LCRKYMVAATRIINVNQCKVRKSHCINNPILLVCSNGWHITMHQSTATPVICYNHLPSCHCFLRASSGGLEELQIVDHSLLRSLQRTPLPALSTPTLELFNVQSLTNKSLLIRDHILDKALYIIAPFPAA